MKSDYQDRGRVYFPAIDFNRFDDEQKTLIEADIKKDFDDAYLGIVQLPKGARFGVYLAYIYYINLFKKIKKMNSRIVKEERIRVRDSRKMMLLVSSAFREKLNLI